MTEERLNMIEERLERIEAKLDAVIETRTAVKYLTWIMGGVWVALGSMFAAFMTFILNK